MQCILAEMLAAYPLYLNFGVAAPGGDLRCSAVPLLSPVNVADRMYFRTAMQTGQFAIGDYQIGRVTGLPSISYAYPLVGSSGSVKGVVFAAQSLNWLTTALSNVTFPPGAILVVTDRNGTVLARRPDSGDWIGKKLPEQRVLAMVSGQTEGGVFEADHATGVSRLWVHAPLIAGHDLHATLGTPKSVAFADIDRRLIRNLAGLGLATILALAAALSGGRFILRQIDALVAATGKLASGELTARASVLGSGSELGLLASAFNAMAAMLQVRERDLRIAQDKTRNAEVELAVTHAQMDIATQIQRSLLPDKPLTLDGVQFAGRCIPADAVGGDYFGYFPRAVSGVDSLGGDVSGHGVGPALLMDEARTMFLAARLVATSAAQILAKLNDLLLDDLERAGQFISASCAIFDAASRELSYANAGHPPALLLRAGTTSWATLTAEGGLLGISRDMDFTEVKVTLRAGDIVVFYTDGITEAQNGSGEMFGVQRLGEAVAAFRADDPEILITGVLESLKAFAGGTRYEDDLTVVAMKLTG